VAVAPERVRIWFSEPIDPVFSRIEVFAVDGATRVDNGDPRIDSDGALSVSLKPGLPTGAYTVAWQVFTPGDGHQTSGTYSFGVGTGVVADPTLATERTPLGDLVRFLALLGQCLGLGIVVFRWAIRLEDPGRFRESLFWPVQVVRLALGLGTLGALYVQTTAMDAPVIAVLTTSWGAAWLVRAVMTVIVIFKADSFLRGNETNGGLLASGFLLLATSFTSHSVARYGMLGAGLDAVHISSAAVWSGGVICAALALANGERNFLARFSVLAVAAVGGLVVSGLWLANGQVGSWSALLLTEYGRALIWKLGVVALAFGLGAVNGLALSSHRFEKFINILPLLEAGLALGVLGSAAVLTNLPPAYSQVTDGSPTRLAQTKSTGDITVTLTLSPARLGVNRVDAQLADAAGEALPARTIRMQFVPVEIPGGGAVVSDLPLAEVGGGLYSAAGPNLTKPGDWQVLVVVDERHFLNFDVAVGPDDVARPKDEPLSRSAQWVDGLNRYALVFGAGLLLLAAAGWSALAWRLLRQTADAPVQLAMWLVPGLLLAGAAWLWIKLLF
jgi:copper transport protein